MNICVSHSSSDAPINSLRSRNSAQRNICRGYLAMDKELEKIQRECLQLSHHEFSFENLVFQSVGLKSIAYAGVYRALEIAGAVGQLRRVAGCGTGALAASMVAASLSSEDMEDGFSASAPNYNIEKAACGLVNYKQQYGWKSAEKVTSRLGNMLKKKLGSSNVTFKEVYDRKGIELCIVVTNVSRLREEYCHPKTTPNLPIKVAVKMSLAVPGLSKPCKFKVHDTEDYFVDGSVVTPYPLHSFDGWYLSMKPEDSFLCRLKPSSRDSAIDVTRFGIYNDKTVGVVMFGSNDRDTLRRNFEVRDGVLDGSDLADAPKTNLLRGNSRKKQKTAEQEAENKLIFESATRLMQAFTSSRLSMENKIAKKDLDEFISTGNVRQDVDRLFGSGACARVITKTVGKGKSKRVTFRQIVDHLEAKVGGMHSWMSGNKSFSIATVADFNRALNATTSSVNSEVYLKATDSERTIGINTGYIESMDTKIEPGDQKFLLLQGMRATLAFLKFWTQNHSTRSSDPPSSSNDSSVQNVQPEVHNAGLQVLLHHPAVVFHGISQSNTSPIQSAAVISGRSRGNAVSQSIFQAPIIQQRPNHQSLTTVSEWVNQSFMGMGPRPVFPTPQAQQHPWNFSVLNPNAAVPVSAMSAMVLQPSAAVATKAGPGPFSSQEMPSSPPHYSGVSDPPNYNLPPPGANGHLYPSLPTSVSN